MSDKTILSRIEDLMVDQLGVERENIKPESNIFADLGADSLDGVELVMAVEEEFKLDIPDEDAEKLTTPAAFVAYVGKHTHGR